MNFTNITFLKKIIHLVPLIAHREKMLKAITNNGTHSFRSADGNYEVTLMTKATVKFTGEVSWKPPAIYKSSCEINVEYFPFDEQSCIMKFGSWTYNGAQVITPK